MGCQFTDFQCKSINFWAKLITKSIIINTVTRVFRLSRILYNKSLNLNGCTGKSINLNRISTCIKIPINFNNKAIALNRKSINWTKQLMSLVGKSMNVINCKLMTSKNTYDFFRISMNIILLCRRSKHLNNTSTNWPSPLGKINIWLRLCILCWALELKKSIELLMII